MPLDSSLLTKVARKLGQAPAYAEGPHPVSILSAAAGCYGLTADIEELTQPTGYDPDAARLFEAIIESAFVVAHADGEFDDDGAGDVSPRGALGVRGPCRGASRCRRCSRICRISSPRTASTSASTWSDARCAGPSRRGRC